MIPIFYFMDYGTIKIKSCYAFRLHMPLSDYYQSYMIVHPTLPGNISNNAPYYTLYHKIVSKSVFFFLFSSKSP